jgi:hypothetical protein
VLESALTWSPHVSVTSVLREAAQPLGRVRQRLGSI